MFIFFGVFTFLRYLGAWPEFGWSWNRRPVDGGRMPSAENIECILIGTSARASLADRAAFYGWTNVWLERLGAHSDEPFTIHEFQHISIAGVFAFAGTLGLLLESPRVRRTISAAIRPEAREPPSYAFGSFSPIPALVIIVCGLSMAARTSRSLGSS